MVAAITAAVISEPSATPELKWPLARRNVPLAPSKQKNNRNHWILYNKGCLLVCSWQAGLARHGVSLSQRLVKARC